MGVRFLLSAFYIFILSTAFLLEPADNDNSPSGCSGSGCHTFREGTIAVRQLNNLQVEIMMKEATGRNVGAELVDRNGNIVDFKYSTDNKRLTLSAPQTGEYILNAGTGGHSLQWESVKIRFNTARINIPVPAQTRSSFELYPNHPNPFNNETIIKFSLPHPANMDLMIFDAKSQMVRHLAHGYFSTGIHNFRWNGKDDQGRPSPSGVYLCEIKSGTHRLVRRLILSK